MFCLWFRVQGLGFRVLGSGFGLRVCGLRLGCITSFGNCRASCVDCRASSSTKLLTEGVGSHSRNPFKSLVKLSIKSQLNLVIP